MQHRHRFLALLLVCQLLIGLGVAPVALAQDSSAQATPTTTPEDQGAPRFALIPVGDHPDGYFDDVEVAPGETIDLAVKAVNLGTMRVSLTAYKANAGNSVNGGFAAASAEEEASGLTTWIDFPTTSLDLAPGDEKEMTFSVTVPAEAKPGQYISAITVETPEAISLAGSTSLDFRLAYSVSVGILVPGEMTSSFELGEPEITVNNLLTTLSVPITSTGNYLVSPAGELTLTNADGDVVVSSPIAMQSVYAGNSTSVQLSLPDQMAAGTYTLDLALTDPDSGATGSIDGVSVTVPAPANPRGVSIASATVEPNAEEIAFANVDVALTNGGAKVPTSNVTLEVLRDGEKVDSFPLATNQLLMSGENTYTARYIPADAWESGTYTFQIIVSAVDPKGGQETNLLSQDLDAEIVVP